MYSKVSLQVRKTTFDPISTVELCRNLKNYLTEKGVEYSYANFELKHGGLKVMIALKPEAAYFDMNPVIKMNPTLKVKDPYTMTAKLKEILRGLIDDDPTITFTDKINNKPHVVINLLPKEVLNTILPAPAPGYQYAIANVLNTKGYPSIVFETRKVRNVQNNNNRNKQYK